MHFQLIFDRLTVIPALKHLTRADRPFHRDTPFVQFLSSYRIAQRDRIIDNLQDGDIRLAADFEATDAILPTDSAGGVHSAIGNDLIEAQTQRQEFGQDRR